ncbi:MAG: DNA-processing protein DprA [Chromatiales bacterium]|nr:DNA-processing protein DprA [Chromatiales bacterium]
MEARRAWLALHRAPGIGSTRLREALARAGDAPAVLAAGPAAWRELGFPEPARDWLAAPDHARLDTDLRWLDAPANHLILPGDAAWPVLLEAIDDPPAGLFVTGDPGLLAAPQLAIVGSRSATAGGLDNARAFARYLAGLGLVITSGMAHGIDAAAHRGALDAGAPTLAVLGCGTDVIYPAAHAQLQSAITSAGATVSEFAPGTPARAGHFPRRNRIISGLSLGVLVVEAAPRSGSLITARLAAEQGREVFAIPGSIHNPQARGCHQLIREGAKLIETAQEIIEELGPLAAVGAARRPAAATPRGGAEFTPDADHQRLLEAMGFDPVSMDQLCERTGMRAAEVSSMLLVLELDGRVSSAPGGRYQRLRAG